MSRLRHISWRIRLSLLALAALVCASGPVLAQNVTSGALSGIVTDDQNGILPGVDIEAVHQPTGTVYTTVSREDGTFAIPSVRVGGPYAVTAKLSSFRDQTMPGVMVSLGSDQPVNFKMQLATVAEQVTVTAEVNPVFAASRSGTSANIERATIENMPTVSRTIEDFARLNPHFTPTPVNDGTASAISVAGRNTRYNSFQIDGAANNDIFGLSDSGAPGGPAGTQPVSLDAIQEIQLVVTSYDVRQGGFAGGGMNAITRSGSNDFHGTGYYVWRDQGFVGDGVDNRPIAQFSDRQFGASLGGPVVKNRAFFFGNVDYGRREAPSGFSIAGSGQRFGSEADAARFLDILQRRYNYNAGGTDEFIKATDNDKLFVRGDFNVGKSQLTVRHNFIDGINDVGFPSTSTYVFPDFFYNFASTTNSTVGQLNSTFGSFFNELRVTYTRVRDNRDGDTRFPRVDVRTSDNRILRAGTENFSTANQLDQDVVEVTNDLTMVRGKHTLTFGTHNEFFQFYNLFIRDLYGNYEFANLDLFEQGLAQAYFHSFSATGDPLEAANFSVNQLGFYAGDQWKVSPNFTLTYGVRADIPLFPDTPASNAVVENLYGFNTDVTPSSTPNWSPRVGFNWNLGGDTRQQLRGGVGIFSGRTPYVWLSNQYTNTGNEFTRITVNNNANNRIPFSPDPDNQPRNIGTAATNEINMIDPDYRFPSSIRGNLTYDRALPLGLVGSFEVLFGRNINDIDYRNLNLLQTQTLPDGRPFYGRVSSQFSDVVLLTNTDEGDQWSVSGSVERPFRRGFYIRGSYMHGRSRSVSDGGSSQARSNWANVYSLDPNAAALARSNFEVRHRINLGIIYDFKILNYLGATASIFYNGQSGRPYVVTFGQNVNGDGSNFNDLLYVPAGPNEVVVQNGTWEDLDRFIQNDPSLRDYRGTFAPRNAGFAPWVDGLDAHFAVNVPTRRIKTEVTFDLLNLINLFDSSSGLIDFALFNQSTAIGYGGVDQATGRFIYNLSTINSPSFRKFNRDDLRSRWQLQMGLRVRF